MSIRKHYLGNHYAPWDCLAVFIPLWLLLQRPRILRLAAQAAGWTNIVRQNKQIEYLEFSSILFVVVFYIAASLLQTSDLAGLLRGVEGVFAVLLLDLIFCQAAAYCFLKLRPTPYEWAIWTLLAGGALFSLFGA